MSADPTTRPSGAAGEEPGAIDAYADATIAQLGAALASGAVTSTQLTEACLARVAERDPSINAFILVLKNEAMAQAAEADRAIAAGRHRGPLHGVPISIKDIIDVRGTPTTAASRVRLGHVAARDASIVERLREAGAVLIGKTNLHEFAVGTTNEDSAFGAVHHPLDPGLSPGGSSGGSAASVLANMAYASVGTDTGGSVRIPSAACGLVGLKPSLGEIALDGVVPLSTTLDHAGPLCRTVEDASILFDALTGTPATRVAGADHGPPTLGVLRGYFTALLHPEVSLAFEAACARLAAAGARLEPAELSHAGDIAPVYLHILLAEAAAYHSKTLEGRGADYTPEVRSRLELGRYVLAEDYVRALRGRDVLRKQVASALGTRSALLLPTLAIPAPKLGSTTVRMGASDEPVRSVMLRLTQLFNITGHPAITLPCGSTSLDLPVGLQLVGTDTRRLLATAAVVERYLGPGTSRWGSGRSAGG